MKQLLAALALACAFDANATQNIFEINPDSHNAKFADCAFRDYENSAKLISIYMQSLIAQKYAVQCSADFLADVKDGARKQKAMPPAVEKQVDACYSTDDIATIKTTVRKVVDTIPQFCESSNVAEAIKDWADNLKQEN